MPFKKSRPSSGAPKGHKVNLTKARGQKGGKVAARSQEEGYRKVKGMRGDNFKQKQGLKKPRRSGEVTKKPKFKSKRKGRK